jgi:hypothetical protein
MAHVPVAKDCYPSFAGRPARYLTRTTASRLERAIPPSPGSPRYSGQRPPSLRRLAAHVSTHSHHRNFLFPTQPHIDMAGAKHSRAGRMLKAPSSISDHGTLADVPLSDDAQDMIAPLSANVNEALRIVSKLERSGLNKQQISLPKYVVLGQQSASKSSVIEAISGIKTPRDPGTCTRVLLLSELQPSSHPRAAWRADIYLLRQYDFPTEARHFQAKTDIPGWIPAAVPKREHFVETDNPNHLEYLIRCAQRAIPSPLENPASFLDPDFNISNRHKALFSPNIVCIVVSRPDLPPLSFFDLPGMIGQAETPEEEYTVLLVKNLVTKYITDPEAIVLVTCALENNVANLIAAGLAKDLKVTDRGRCNCLH